MNTQMEKHIAATKMIKGAEVKASLPFVPKSMHNQEQIVDFCMEQKLFGFIRFPLFFLEEIFALEPCQLKS